MAIENEGELIINFKKLVIYDDGTITLKITGSSVENLIEEISTNFPTEMNGWLDHNKRD